MKNNNMGKPPDLFDSLGYLVHQWMDDSAARTIKNEKRHQRQQRNDENLAKALAAFEAEDWMAGLRFAEKTNMKDTRIQYYMGCFYEDGFSLERSPYMAAKWYEKAAEHGNEEAKRRLARMRKEGYSWYFSEEAELPVLKRCREAAERGDAMAQVDWGLWRYYLDNEAEAVEWYRKSAMQGNAKGQCCLATAYEEGYGVGKDIDEALRWYRLAAENGDYIAESKLESQYKIDFNHRVVPKEELVRDYVKCKDGLFALRYKTGNWLPLVARWMPQELKDAIAAIHKVRTKNMSKACREASLGDKIFGVEGPEHDGYGTGALQKWADKRVAEGKDPHEVNLLEWFKGASEALDYHMGGTFEKLMKEAENDSWHFMRYMVEKMDDCMPELRKMSLSRLDEAIKNKYYTIKYAPYGEQCMMNI